MKSKAGAGTVTAGLVVMAMAAAVASCGLAAPARVGAGGAMTPGAIHAARATIDRDDFGVPSISGTDESDVVYTLAYAMAEDGFYALEDAYAAAIGRASAYYGSSRLEGDKLRAALTVAARARAELGGMPTTERALLQAFTDGLNAYVRDHPGAPPRHIAHFEPWMVVAYANDVTWVQAVERALAIPVDTVARATLAVSAHGDSASILLVASRDALPYEMQVRTSDGVAFHGFTTLGLPYAREGFSERVAYAAAEYDMRSHLIAVDASAAASVIRLSHVDTLPLNTDKGVVQVAVTTMQSPDGPVVATRNDTAFVLRTSAIPRAVLHNMRAMMHATDIAGLASVEEARAGRGNTDRIDARSGAREVHVFAPGRQAQAESMLRADNAWTIQKLIRFAFDTRANAAEQDVASIVDEWEQVGARNPEKAQALDSAVAILRGWNRLSTVESAAMTLYAEYALALENEAPGAFRHFSALEAVVRDGRRFPARPWGAANAIRRVDGGATSAAMPAAGAPLRTGTLFTFDARSPRQFYVWAVDLRSGVAGSVLSYGASYGASSAHWFDQAPLFAAGSLKPAALRGGGSGHAYHPGESH